MHLHIGVRFIQFFKNVAEESLEHRVRNSGEIKRCEGGDSDAGFPVLPAGYRDGRQAVILWLETWSGWLVAERFEFDLSHCKIGKLHVLW